MRPLSFITFLENYIQDLSGIKTLNIHKLTKSSKRNYRLLDSLMLYCSLTNKKDIFNKYTNNKYKYAIEFLNEKTMLDQTYSDYDFAKIWDSYQHKINEYEYNNNIKSKIRDKIVKKMEEKNITNYRVYTDLKLNPGNINDYLTNGNSTKVSLPLVKKIYQYVSNK